MSPILFSRKLKICENCHNALLPDLKQTSYPILSSQTAQATDTQFLKLILQLNISVCQSYYLIYCTGLISPLLSRPLHLLNQQWKILITHASNSVFWSLEIMLPFSGFPITLFIQWIHTSCYLDVVSLFIHTVNFVMAVFSKPCDHNVSETF